MLKDRKNIAIVGLLITCVVLAIYILTDNQRDQRNTEEMRAELSDSLSYFQKINMAQKALFADDLNTAILLFEQADKLLAGHSKKTADLPAVTFISRVIKDRDTLVEIDSIIKDLGLTLSTSYILSGKLKDSLLLSCNQNDSLIRLFYHARVELQKNIDLVKILENKNDSLIADGERIKSSFGQLEFKNVKGLKVIYVGYLTGGMAHGYGMGMYETGSFYKGEWYENKRHGQGKFQWANGDIYIGQFELEERSGQGTYHFKSGEKYVGGWKNGVKDGYGEYFSAEGKILLKGEWKDDKLVKQPGQVGLEW